MKQFRKIVAVLLAALMLCTILPLSAPVYAADNLITKGDFENGSANWTLHNDSDTVTEVVEDPTGSGRGKVMHTNSTYTTSSGRDDMFYQTVNLEAGADYLLTFKVYCYSTASNAAFIVNFYDPTTGNKVSYNTTDVTGLPASDIQSSSAIRVRLNVNANTGKWIDVTMPFNAGQSTSPRILFANYRTGAGQYYFDDVVLTKVGADEPEEPEAVVAPETPEIAPEAAEAEPDPEADEAPETPDAAPGAAVYPADVLDGMRAAGAQIDELDALSLAEQAGSAKAANVVLMGRLARYFDIAPEKWLAALKATVAPKFYEMNVTAFDLGYGA